MALGMYFRPSSFTPTQYKDVIERLKAAGDEAPPGRLYHAAFEVDGQIQVFDVWDSQGSFEAFDRRLVPILTELGVDPVQPQVSPIRNVIDPQQVEKVGMPHWLSGLAGNTLVATLAVGVASALLIALRLISVAKFNIETTYGILQASGTGAVIVGTVISLIPGIAVTVALASGLVVIFYNGMDDRIYFPLWVTIVFFSIIASVTTPVEYLPVILACVVGIVVARLFRKHIRRWSPRLKRIVATYVAAIFAIILMVGVIQGSPWGPEEHFIFKGSQQVTGYLLSQTDTTTAILQARPREIGYYATAQLTTQDACKNVPWYGFPVIYFVPGFDPVHYVPCH